MTPHPYYPHIRPEEAQRRRPKFGRTVGLMMWVEGKQYFFPGFSPQSAGMLAELALGRDKIELDSTRVEWGTGATGKWDCERVLKVPKEPEPDKVEEKAKIEYAPPEVLVGG